MNLPRLSTDGSRLNQVCNNDVEPITLDTISEINPNFIIRILTLERAPSIENSNPSTIYNCYHVGALYYKLFRDLYLGYQPKEPLTNGIFSEIELYNIEAKFYQLGGDDFGRDSEEHGEFNFYRDQIAHLTNENDANMEDNDDDDDAQNNEYYLPPPEIIDEENIDEDDWENPYDYYISVLSGTTAITAFRMALHNYYVREHRNREMSVLEEVEVVLEYLDDYNSYENILRFYNTHWRFSEDNDVNNGIIELFHHHITSNDEYNNNNINAQYPNIIKFMTDNNINQPLV